MLQIHVLSGTQAGQRYRIGQFPSIIGRSSSAGIRMEEPGIWEKHLSIDLDGSGAFIVKIFPGALTSLNGRSIETAFLRNGDVIEIGARPAVPIKSIAANGPEVALLRYLQFG